MEATWEATDVEIIDSCSRDEDGQINILEISVLVEVLIEDKRFLVNYQTTMLDYTRPSTTLEAYTGGDNIILEIKELCDIEDEDEIFLFLKEIAELAEVQKVYDEYIQETYELTNENSDCIETEENFQAVAKK